MLSTLQEIVFLFFSISVLLSLGHAADSHKSIDESEEQQHAVNEHTLLQIHATVELEDVVFVGEHSYEDLQERMKASSLEWLVSLDEVSMTSPHENHNDDSSLVEMERTLQLLWSFHEVSSTGNKDSQSLTGKTSLSLLMPLETTQPMPAQSTDIPQQTRTLVVAIWEHETDTGRRRCIARRFVHVPKQKMIYNAYYNDIGHVKDSHQKRIYSSPSSSSSSNVLTEIEIKVSGNLKNNSDFAYRTSRFEGNDNGKTQLSPSSPPSRYGLLGTAFVAGIGLLTVVMFLRCPCKSGLRLEPAHFNWLLLKLIQVVCGFQEKHESEHYPRGGTATVRHSETDLSCHGDSSIMLENEHLDDHTCLSCQGNNSFILENEEHHGQPQQRQQKSGTPSGVEAPPTMQRRVIRPLPDRGVTFQAEMERINGYYQSLSSALPPSSSAISHRKQHRAYGQHSVPLSLRGQVIMNEQLKSLPNHDTIVALKTQQSFNDGEDKAAAAAKVFVNHVFLKRLYGNAEKHEISSLTPSTETLAVEFARANRQRRGDIVINKPRLRQDIVATASTTQIMPAASTNLIAKRQLHALVSSPKLEKQQLFDNAGTGVPSSRSQENEANYFGSGGLDNREIKISGVKRRRPQGGDHVPTQETDGAEVRKGSTSEGPHCNSNDRVTMSNCGLDFKTSYADQNVQKVQSNTESRPPSLPLGTKDNASDLEAPSSVRGQTQDSPAEMPKLTPPSNLSSNVCDDHGGDEAVSLPVNEKTNLRCTEIGTALQEEYHLAEEGCHTKTKSGNALIRRAIVALPLGGQNKMTKEELCSKKIPVNADSNRNIQVSNSNEICEEVCCESDSGECSLDIDGKSCVKKIMVEEANLKDGLETVEHKALEGAFVTDGDKEAENESVKEAENESVEDGFEVVECPGDYENRVDGGTKASEVSPPRKINDRIHSDKGNLQLEKEEISFEETRSRAKCFRLAPLSSNFNIAIHQKDTKVKEIFVEVAKHLNSTSIDDKESNVTSSHFPPSDFNKESGISGSFLLNAKLQYQEPDVLSFEELRAIANRFQLVHPSQNFNTFHGGSKRVSTHIPYLAPSFPGTSTDGEPKVESVSLKMNKGFLNRSCSSQRKPQFEILSQKEMNQASMSPNFTYCSTLPPDSECSWYVQDLGQPELQPTPTSDVEGTILGSSHSGDDHAKSCMPLQGEQFSTDEVRHPKQHQMPSDSSSPDQNKILHERAVPSVRLSTGLSGTFPDILRPANDTALSRTNLPPATLTVKLNRTIDFEEKGDKAQIPHRNDQVDGVESVQAGSSVAKANEDRNSEEKKTKSVPIDGNEEPCEAKHSIPSKTAIEHRRITPDVETQLGLAAPLSNTAGQSGDDSVEIIESPVKAKRSFCNRQVKEVILPDVVPSESLLSATMELVEGTIWQYGCNEKDSTSRLSEKKKLKRIPKFIHEPLPKSKKPSNSALIVSRKASESQSKCPSVSFKEKRRKKRVLGKSSVLNTPTEHSKHHNSDGEWTADKRKNKPVKAWKQGTTTIESSRPSEEFTEASELCTLDDKDSTATDKSAGNTRFARSSSCILLGVKRRRSTRLTTKLEGDPSSLSILNFDMTLGSTGTKENKTSSDGKLRSNGNSASSRAKRRRVFGSRDKGGFL